MSFRSIRFLTLILFCLLVGSSTGNSQAQQSENSSKPCVEHKKLIDAELARNHEVVWMGEYHAFMDTFSLAPTAGFFFFRGSDYVYWSCAWGRVEVREGKIKLIPDPTVPVEGTRGLALEWTPITWGDRNYLIATDRLLDFVNSVNNGYEPGYRFPGIGASFYKKTGDEDRQVSGFPNVPESYRRYLLEKPIRGRVISVGSFQIEKIDNGKTEIKTTIVTLDVGAKDGVIGGMRFVTYKPSRVHEDIVITKVLENRSEGVVRQEGKIYNEPSIKWKVSTSTRDIK